MKKFWTLTDKHTQYTNSRSQRFDSKDAAIFAAKDRLQNRDSSEVNRGVYVMECVAIVEEVRAPIEVREIN